jgi:ribosomal-protein-alanine N-acetyltransferase
VDLGDVSEDREVTVHAEVYDFNPGSGRVLKVGFEHLTMRKYGIWKDGKLAGLEV